jgi:hypothetical protein
MEHHRVDIERLADGGGYGLVHDADYRMCDRKGAVFTRAMDRGEATKWRLLGADRAAGSARLRFPTLIDLLLGVSETRAFIRDVSYK